MYIISNHLLTLKPNLNLPSDTIVRINLAWVKNYEEIKEFIERTHYPIFLDYPIGRIKPPKPGITIREAILIANRNKNIRYFAISNIEEDLYMVSLRLSLRKDIVIVPKIETRKGILNLYHIVKGAQTDIIMLDKEDLYWECDRNDKQYNDFIDLLKNTAKKENIKILTIQGVIFTEVGYE